MTGLRPKTVRAYSLIEIIVVISIIAILLSLAGIGINSVVNSNRVRDTEATMAVLEAAIREFVNEKPLEQRSIRVDGLSYTQWFGNLPPCPVTPFPLFPQAIQSPGPEPADGEATVPTRERFNALIKRYLQGANELGVAREWPKPGGGVVNLPPDPRIDCPSIECLVLFLTECSPRAKAMIDKLPAERKTNLDKDKAIAAKTDIVGGGGGVSSSRVDLIEITDSWDRPLRWTVMPFDQNVGANLNLPVRWELRSAGKDGVFEAPFSKVGDDVVWPKGTNR